MPSDATSMKPCGVFAGITTTSPGPMCRFEPPLVAVSRAVGPISFEKLITFFCYYSASTSDYPVREVSAQASAATPFVREPKIVWQVQEQPRRKPIFGSNPVFSGAQGPIRTGCAGGLRMDVPMLGFELTLWDYLTFLVLFLGAVAFLVAAVFVLGLPGRIAIARRHPEAAAVNIGTPGIGTLTSIHTANQWCANTEPSTNPWW